MFVIGKNYFNKCMISGKEPMGLLWAMKPEKGSKSGVRLSKKDVTVPFDVNLTVIDGHHDIAVHTDISERNVLCKMSHPRTYMGAGVRRLLVREGRLRGALYLPPGLYPTDYNLTVLCILICVPVCMMLTNLQRH